MVRKLSREINSFLLLHMARAGVTMKQLKRELGIKSGVMVPLLLSGVLGLPMDSLEALARILKLDEAEERKMRALAMRWHRCFSQGGHRG